MVERMPQALSSRGSKRQAQHDSVAEGPPAKRAARGAGSAGGSAGRAEGGAAGSGRKAARGQAPAPRTISCGGRSYSLLEDDELVWGTEVLGRGLCGTVSRGWCVLLAGSFLQLTFVP